MLVIIVSSMFAIAALVAFFSIFFTDSSETGVAIAMTMLFTLASLFGFFVIGHLVPDKTEYKKVGKFTYTKEQTQLIIKTENPQCITNIDDIYVYNTINDSSQVYVEYEYNSYSKIISMHVRVKYHDTLTGQDIYK